MQSRAEEPIDDVLTVPHADLHSRLSMILDTAHRRVCEFGTVIRNAILNLSSKD